MILRGLTSHRALRDWPEGHVTPRLTVLVARVSQCCGGTPSCPAAARAGDP